MTIFLHRTERMQVIIDCNVVVFCPPVESILFDATYPLGLFRMMQVVIFQE